MSDEFDVYHANHEEAQEIIDWAIATAGMVTLMSTEPDTQSIEQVLAKMDRYDDAVRMMLESMPEILVHAGATVAGDAIEAAEEEERAVEEFRQELDEL